MTKLIIEENTQLKQMKTEMEKLIKESKKSAKQISPLEALPITSIPTAISATTIKRDVADQLATTLQNMTLQTE